MAQPYSRASSFQSKAKESDQKNELQLWKIFDIILRDYKGRARLHRVRHLFPSDWTESDIKSRLETDPGQRLTVLINKGGDISFLSVHCKAKLCINYGQGHCTKPNCNNFHLCRSYLAGHCRHGVMCPQSHSFQLEFNKNLVTKFRLAKYSENELRCIVRRSILQVCSLYNRSECTHGDGCSFLHVCEAFIMKDCGKPECRLEHSLDTEHGMRLMKCFKLDRLYERDRNKFKKCLMTKKDAKLNKHLQALRVSDRKMETGHTKQGHTDSREPRRHDGSEYGVESVEEATEVDTEEDNGEAWITLKSRYSSGQTEATSGGPIHNTNAEFSRPGGIPKSHESASWVTSQRANRKTEINPKEEYTYETRATTRGDTQSSRRSEFNQNKYREDHRHNHTFKPGVSFTETDYSQQEQTRPTKPLDEGGSSNYVLFTPLKNKSGKIEPKRYPSGSQRITEDRPIASARQVDHNDLEDDDQLAFSIKMQEKNYRKKPKGNHTFGMRNLHDTSVGIDDSDISKGFGEDSDAFGYPASTTPDRHNLHSHHRPSYETKPRSSLEPTKRETFYSPYRDNLGRPKTTTRHAHGRVERSIPEVFSASTEPQFVCNEYVLRGSCHATDCKYLHAHRPFAWFANVFDEWHQFDEEEEVKIERAMRDKTSCKVKIRLPGYSVNAQVDTRNLAAVALDDQMSTFQVKRIGLHQE